VSGRPGVHRDSIIGQIAQYVDEARSEPLSEHVRQAAWRCILDLLSAAGAATDDPGTAAVRRVALTTLGSGSVPVWFSGESGSVKGAAWANSAAAAALDLDDGHRLAMGHPGAAVIPAALAVGHDTGAALDDVIAAIVIGYEVGVTVAAARLAYGTTGTWSSYAVVAAAAALRRTPPDVLMHALGIAGESAPNQAFLSTPAPPPGPEGSDVKEGIPWSVVTGLAALDLAEEGMTGPRNILDSTAHYRFPDPLTLGLEPQICRTYVKLYACCRHVHAPLDALGQLVSEHDLRPESIDAIHVETYDRALQILNGPSPAHLVDVQYSVPYCLGLRMLDGPSALLPLTVDGLAREDVTALARKVSLAVDPALDSRYPQETLARVTVTCGDRSFVSDVTAPRGEASDPLTWEELEDKFVTATRLVAAPASQQGVLASIRSSMKGDSDALAAMLGTVTFNGSRVSSSRTDE
jgi:2-methylcitrate dehydratase PrpD